MRKRLLMCAVAVLFAAGVAFTAQKDAGKTGSWSGWITDAMCGAKGANAGHAGCAMKCVKEHGGKFALYDTENKKIYILDPQDKAAENLGHPVTVTGTLEGDTLHVKSISPSQ
jgi:Protein of unknown function (DUF5818)